jgi:hypothetical protein
MIPKKLRMKKYCSRAVTIFTALIFLGGALAAQSPLNKVISVDINRQRLDQTLEIISNKGEFYFSYNSNILKKDSLVSLNISNSSVKNILTQLFGNQFEFRESGNYIILRRAPIRLKLITSSTMSDDKYYTISGYVIDDQTGLRISDASVYEKDRLAVTNTNANGFFKIKLKSKYHSASITVSKEYYEDTTVTIQTRQNQTLTITLVPLDITESTTIIGPHGYEAPESIDLQVPLNDSTRWIYRYVKQDSFVVEKTALGKWLVSSKQRIQSINLRKFFVLRPYQVSVIPGVSTNGKLNSQVVNNFSFNIFGGYSGGTNGFELGGLFNIDKKSVQYTQIGGVANVVGGHAKGAQIAGITNTVLDSVSGFQAGGVSNFVADKFSGMQVAGVYNHVGATLDGMQVAGVVNFTNHKTHGVQLAGVGNISSREVGGVQIAGVFNYTRRLKGTQIGLINVSDTSSGYSIGLINIVFKGYHKLSLYTNELINLNVAVKSGNTKLYSIFLGGYNSVPDEKAWTFGYGLGSEFISKKHFVVNMDLTSQHLYLGSWDFYNLQNKANVQLSYRFGKYFSIFAGPSYTVYVSNQDVHFAGYKELIPPSGYKTHKFGDKVTGWFGWSAGVNIF